MIFCKKQEPKKLKVLEISHSKKNLGNNSIDGKHFYVGERPQYSVYDDEVLMNSNLYVDIFAKKRIADSPLRKRLAIVKITRTSKKTGKKTSIYRSFAGASASDFDTEKMALSYSSLRLLSTIYFDKESKDYKIDKAEGGETYEVTKGNFIMFIFTHPNYIVLLAAYSCLIGIVGILISIFGIIFH